MNESSKLDESILDSLTEINKSESSNEKLSIPGLGNEDFYEREVNVDHVKDRYRYDIYFYQKWILIKRQRESKGLNLWINRETCECKEHYGSPASPGEYPIIHEYAFAILGILRISFSAYLVIVTQETYITTLNLPKRHKINVYMIASAACLAVSPLDVGAVDEYAGHSPSAIKKSIGTATSWFSQHFKLGSDKDSTWSESYRTEIKRQILLVERLLENGFYYSADGDLGIKFQDMYTNNKLHMDSNLHSDSTQNNSNIDNPINNSDSGDEDPFDFVNINQFKIGQAQGHQPSRVGEPMQMNKSGFVDDATKSNVSGNCKNEMGNFASNDKCDCIWSSSGNDSFKWNLNMGAGVPCCWLTCVIQGYCISQTTLTSQGELTLILIGRRSIHRPGTRITCRGIDDSGHVANFVETELAVILPNGHLSSLVMCRGSVPVFWEQTSIMSSPNITHCVEMVKRPFLSHLTDLCNNYGHILCVNLLNYKSELCLTEMYTEALKSVNGEFSLNYNPCKKGVNVVFEADVSTERLGKRVNLLDLSDLSDTFPSNTNDMTAEINNIHGLEIEEKIDQILDVEELQYVTAYPFTGDLAKLSVSLMNYDFASNVNIFNNAHDLIEYVSTSLVRFMKSHQQLVVDREGKVISRQKGCIRVNCLDCLDRTNAFQWCYGWIWLIKIFESVALTDYNQNDIALKDTANPSIPLRLSEIYKLFWSEHGDAISLFYAGTASIYSSYILQGSSNISVALNFARTYIDRIRSHMLEDQQRSEAMELILAKNKPKEFVNSHMESTILLDHLDTQSKNLKIWCGTWNLGGMRVQECENLQDWLNYGVPCCDIYAFFIQELVELTTFRVLTNWNDSAKQNMLEDMFKSILKNFRVSYLKVRSISLLGLCLVIYAKASLVDSITDVEVSSIKTGLNGNYGNKGAVAVRMKLNTYDLAFVNVHLPPGRSNSNERMEQVDFIVNNIFHGKKSSCYGLSDNDLVFLAGDFNFRLQIPHDEILKYLCKLNLTMLLEHDEFINHKKNDVAPFNYMNEQEITFQPSYKFKKNSPFYDLCRSPAWCDRILFFGRLKQHITPLTYKRHERYCTSDHKPISAIFQIE